MCEDDRHPKSYCPEGTLSSQGGCSGTPRVPFWQATSTSTSTTQTRSVRRPLGRHKKTRAPAASAHAGGHTLTLASTVQSKTTELLTSSERLSRLTLNPNPKLSASTNKLKFRGRQTCSVSWTAHARAPSRRPILSPSRICARRIETPLPIDTLVRFQVASTWPEEAPAPP
jgi:hypothetical protein